ncbi:hypothetical protein [Haliea sp. E17]|uniref:hypothetical protein n=1 Tax=Haliea sp. E17 TaxID=3401576 RepID=UPI003AAD8F27
MYSKHLFHFAMIHEEFGRSGDIFRGLMPLFAPIVAQNSGKYFSSENFCNQVDTFYGIKMHPFVAEDFAPKMAEFGLLEEHVTEHLRQYKYKTIDTTDKSNEEEFEGLFIRFKEFALKLLSRLKSDLSDVDFDSEFMSRLARYGLDTEDSATNGDGENQSGQLGQELDYAFARFVENVYLESGRDQTLLEEAFSGAVLAEVVLSLREPSIDKKDIHGKCFYIDAPILINLLGFSDDYSITCSRTIAEQIVELGGVLTTTDFYLEELRTIIRNSLENYRNRGPRRSNLDSYLFQNPGKVAEVRACQNRVSSLLESKGFSLGNQYVGVASKESSQRAVSLKNSLMPHLGHYRIHDSLEHDALMISYVVSHHGFDSIQNVAESKSFFVTKNSRLVQRASTYLYNAGIFNKPDLAPMLTEKNLAMLLWIIAGGKGKDVSSLVLVSNCNRVVQHRRNLFEGIREFLSSVDPEKRALYEGMITDDRALYFLMDEACGDFETISPENVTSVFERAMIKVTERVEEDAKQDYEKALRAIRAESQSEIEKIQNELDKIRGMSEVETSKARKEQLLEDQIELDKMKRELIDSSLENRSLHGDLSKKSEELDKLKARISEIEFSFEKIKQAADDERQTNIDNARQMFARTEYYSKIFLSLLFAVLAYYLTHVAIDEPIDTPVVVIKPLFVQWLTALITFITTLYFPEIIFGRVVRAAAKFAVSLRYGRKIARNLPGSDFNG